MVLIYLSRKLYKIQLVAHVFPPVSIVFKAARHSFSVKEPSQVVLVQDRVVFMPEEVRWID